MKYLKLFEDIDFEEDWEEIDPDKQPFDVGDVIKVKSPIEYWNSKNSKWVTGNIRNVEFTVKYIEKTENIERDDFTGDFKKGTIPYDGWLFMIHGHWPWFKYEDNLRIEITRK